MLIICACCGRRRKIEKRKRGLLRCTNCGAKAARVIRKIKVWMETGDFDGVEGETARHNTFGQLKEYAEMKGYKPKWADMKFKALFGRKPNGEAVEVGQAPNSELIRWCWKQASAWAKEMRKREAANVKPLEPEKKSVLMDWQDWETKL
jgi:hypothetical protein